jgi:hypothetical protein
MSENKTALYGRREAMSESYTGGCGCGAIRYEISGEPMVQNDCQCRTCQRVSGTGHGSYLTFPRRIDVKLTGKASLWDVASDIESGGDPGNVKSHAFCPTCGSPVYLTFSTMPDLFAIHAASLDDPSRYQPQLVTCGVQAYAWDYVNPALPQFDKMPPK